MTDIITDREYAAFEVADTFYDRYGSEMVTDDGYHQYTAFELLMSLDKEIRKEVLERLAELAA